MPNYSIKLLKKILAFQIDFIANDFKYQGKSFQQMRIQSIFPKFFNAGGDLSYFLKCISNRDKNALLDNAELCLDGLCNLRLISQHLTTVSYLEGHALGGGLDGELAGQYVLAKNKKIKVGFPEARFGLFTGMGAHAICFELFNDWKIAEEFIINGTIYDAKEATENGLIDGVGKIPEKLPFKIKPLFDRSFLNKITEKWADQALNLEEGHLLLIQKLTKMQDSIKMQFLAKAIKSFQAFKKLML